jgi:DNA-directed RNA polymerase specialized sigma24 family protein
VTATTAADLDHALQRYGDDLYRLALLLAPDDLQAARVLLAAARHMAATGAAPDEHALLAALLDALPAERGYWRRRLPAWAVPPAQRSAAAPLLAAIARLPRRQRLALGLTLLRGFDLAQVAPLLGCDEAAAREQVRDALLTLAPRAAPDLAPADLALADAPDACRPTRAGLALGGDTLHNDPAARGHLALCADCRAAEQSWLRLTGAVEDALRGALREVRLPDDLAERLSEAGALQPPAARGRLADPRLRTALVALPVLALIAFLVFPRGARNVLPPGELAAVPPSDPRELIRRASEYLYTPPPGDGAWHAHYAIQWTFAGGTHALLAADQWIESATGRHRLQLTHHDGGGPYEFELGDGAESAWYAVSPVYAPSIYPLSVDMPAPPAQLQATPDEQQRMLHARLQSGAWDLPAAYLRQAQAATILKTWGRQRDVDGAVLSLIGFSGISPLAPPPDAPDVITSQVTVLLAIDEASGRLRELRELIGPPGGEQITRTIWRVEGEEWVADPAAIARAFDLRRAWNGVGAFIARGRMADPALPLVGPEQVESLAIAVQQYWTGLWMLARPPPGVTSALLVKRDPSPISSNSSDQQERLTFVYLGVGRQLELNTQPAVSVPATMPDAEERTLNGQRLTLQAASAQSYQAQIRHIHPFEGRVVVTQVAARGYTRAELLDFLQSLGPPTLDGYRAQARLFADQYPHDTAFEALLGALALPAPPVDGGARHIIEHTFTRHDPAPNELADPYHQPPYSGFPDHTTHEIWTRGTVVGGTQELASSTRDAGGVLLGRSYLMKELRWYYNAPLSQVEQNPGDFAADVDIWSSQRYPTLLNMLGCGQAELSSNPDGTRTLFLTDANWRADSCQHPFYAQFYQEQTAGNFQSGVDNAPYLVDLPEQEVTTWVDLDTNGRLLRAEVRAGTTRDGTLLEAWELERDQQLPPDSVPAAAFDPAPPDALVRSNTPLAPFNQEPTPTHTATLTEALGLTHTPLFGLPIVGAAPVTGSATLTSTATLTATLAYIDVGTPPPEGASHWSGADDALQGAVRDGYAIQMAYSVTAPAGWPALYLYEGSARSFGAYLHATAHWSTSAPLTLQLGDHSTAAWQVIASQGGKTWTLFELDGTLIAVEYPPDKTLAVIAELRPIAAP